jgi:hypothetical protein
MALIEASLFHYDILAHNQTMRRHFLQLWQNSLDVLIEIDECQDQWQVSSGIDQRRRLHPASTHKSGHGVKHRRAIYVFGPEIIEQFKI